MKNHQSAARSHVNNTSKMDASTLKELISPKAFYAFEGHHISDGGNSPWKKAGLCPFHLDRRAGTFYVHINSGAYKCFSCDIKGGDVIDFLMKKYDMTFQQSMEALSNNGGYHE